MRRRRPEVLKIISTADAAVGDPAACPNVLRALTVATDGIGAMLTAGSFHESKHGFIVSSSLSDERGEVYLEHFQVNPLAPSLVQACGIAMRMGQASYEALLTDSLDHLPTAIMLVDDQARVVIANKQAKSLMVSHGGLAITDGILGAIAHTDSVRLREVIRSAALNAVRDDACVIHGSDGTPSFIVSGLPMPDAKAHFGIRYGAHAMLVLSSVEDRVRESAAKCSRLMKLFGLTRMESRVAIAIAKGGSVPEAAHELSIGSQTVRTHLREVFEKTGVNRQSALTRLLTRCGLLDLD